ETPATAPPAPERQQHDHDDGDDDEDSGNARPRPRSLPLSDLAGHLPRQLEPEPLGVLTRKRSDPEEDAATVIALLEPRDHEPVQDPARLGRGDERAGPETGLDLGVAPAVRRRL